VSERPEPVADLYWDADRARAFTERTLDLWTEWLGRLPDLPVHPGEQPQEVRAAVVRDVPDEPLPDDELFAYLREMVFEHSAFTGHPRFMGYITGAGTVPGAAADLLAAGVNMNVGGFALSPSATEIEVHLMKWFAAAFGLPQATAGGLLVSGGAMANFVALKAARDRQAGLDVRQRGVKDLPRMAIYASSEVHVTTPRGADMLGLGEGAVRMLPVDDDYRMRVDALRDAIRADREAGVKPIVVVGTAGTVGTGVVDPLEEIADVCADEGLWFHVDGAYGGPAVLADDLRPLFAGIDRADSIAFDPHKWLYTPHSGGCVLLRDMQHLANSFGAIASYVYQDAERLGHPISLGMFGPQFSRGFQALKVWMSLLAHGRRAYAARISQDARLARYLGERVGEREEFELSAPVGLSICCFRYVPPDMPPAGEDGSNREREVYLDHLNQRLMTEVQLDGRVFFSNAVLGERFVLRACIVNFRTEADDLDAVLDVAAEIGARLDAELRPSALRGAS
jgi:glutamate/tyrosine decarboxylase-like PLP-dependent enzyme